MPAGRIIEGRIIFYNSSSLPSFLRQDVEDEGKEQDKDEEKSSSGARP